MGQTAPRPGPRKGPAVQRPPLRSVTGGVTEHSVDVARQIAEKIGHLPANRDIEITATVRKRRKNHDMLGDEGYALVSRYFMRRVLPYCIRHGILTPTESAVLSNIIGRAAQGRFIATQEEVAEEIGASRQSVGRAFKRLCELNLLRKVQRKVYELNPRVAFMGTGDEHDAFLKQLRNLKLKSQFPDELAPEITPSLTLFNVTDTA